MDNIDNQPTQPQVAPQAEPPAPLPPTPPVASIQVAMQPPSSMQPPKKKRTGLIVGIVLGSIALVSVIVAVLLYFLWWQNPQKVVTDAIVGAITTQQAIVNGTATYESDAVKVKLSLKSSTDAPKSSFDTTISISSDELGEIGDITVRLAGVVDSDGTLYVKAGGIKEVLDAAVDAYLKSTMGAYGSYDDATQQEILDTSKKQVTTMLSPIADKIDGKWLKISADDLIDNDEQQCVMKALTDMRNDKTAMETIGRVYRDHQFLVIKDTKVPSKDGAKGYEIDLTSDEVRKRAEAFGDAIKVTPYISKIQECSQNSDTDEQTSNSDSPLSDDSVKTTLRIWADPLTHKLKHVELAVSDNDNRLNMSYGFEIGVPSTVEVPSDARDMMEVIGEVQRDFQESFGGSQARTSI